MFKQPQKITADERNEAISKYPLLQKAIESGEFEYSTSKLNSDLQAYQLTTWVQVHPVLTGLIFLLTCALGGIPAIIFIAVLIFSKTGRENYELALVKLKNGNLKKNNSLNSKS